MRFCAAIFLYILFAGLESCIAQIGPAIQWQACFGGAANDYNPKLKKTPDGEFIVLSSSSSNNGDVLGNHGSYDGWAVKLDSAGVFEWQKCFGGSAADYSTEIISSLDGGYVLELFTNSNNGQVIGSHGGSEIWIVKLGETGTITWQHPLGGSTSEIPGSLVQLPDSTILVCGYALSNNGNVSGNHGNGDAWVVKLNKDGTIIWQHCYGGPQTDFATAMIMLDDGNCLVAGYTNSNDDDVSGNHGGQDAWAFKIDTAGNLLWQHCYGGTGDEYFSAILNANSFINFAGNTNSVDGDVSDNHGGYDYWVVKTDEGGELVKQKCFGGSGTELLSSVVMKPNNSLALCGESNSNDGDVIGNNSPGINDGWIMRTDSSFNLVWSRCYGGSATEFGFRMIADNDHLLVAGSTNSTDGNIDCTDHGLIDVWLFQTADECDIPIQASFEYEQVDLTFSFNDESNKASTWLWDFGDGSTSTDQNPVHTYATVGIYQVCMGITDSCGYDTTCAIINTCGYAVTSFGYIQNDLTFSFSDSSDNAESWWWDFGDGNTSTEQNPTYTFASPGIYSIKLISSNACNSDSFSVIVNTCGELTADFGYTTYQLFVTFGDSSTSNIDQWAWEFGDGSSSGQQNPNHAYELPGNYTVVLIVTNDCETTFTSQVITVCAAAKAGFSYTSTGADVSFTNTSLYGTSFIWDFGNGVTTSLVSPDYYFGDTGLFNICLTAENICDADDTCITFHNVSIPNLNYCWSQMNSEGGDADFDSQFISADDSNNVIVIGSSGKAGLPLLFENLYTIKYDPQGNLIWKKNLADDFPDDYFQPVDFSVGPDGNILVLFAWQQFPSFYNNWGIFECSSTGTLEWTFDGELTNNESATALAIDGYGNTVVVGSGFGDTFTGDYLIEKIDKDGNAVWKESYDYEGFADVANDVAISSSGKIYVTGTAIADDFDEHEKMATVIYDSNGDFQSQYAEGINFAFGRQVVANKSGDVWVLGGDSYDDEEVTYVQRIGSTEWLQTYSGPPDYDSQTQGISMAVDSSDNVHVIAQVSYEDNNEMDQTYPEILMYDELGSLVYHQEIPGHYISGDNASGFVLTKMIGNDAGKVFYTGYSKPVSSGNNFFDIETGRINADGHIDWQARFDAYNLEDYSEAISLDHSGNVLVAGKTEADVGFFEMIALKYCIECAGQLVTFVMEQDTFCFNSGSYELNGGLPGGGFYSGDGVIDGVFYPDSAGIGEHQILYTVADGDGCISTDTLEVMVDVCTGMPPQATMLFDVFPNPFSTSATISCLLNESGELKIDLLDLSGKVLQNIFSGNSEAGKMTFTISRNNLSEGVYLLQSRFRGTLFTQKVVAAD